MYPECCGYTRGFFEGLAAANGLRCDVLELDEPWPGKLTVIQIRHA